MDIAALAQLHSYQMLTPEWQLQTDTLLWQCVKPAPSQAGVPGTETMQNSPGHNSSPQSKTSVSLIGTLVHLPIDSGFQELQNTNS